VQLNSEIYRRIAMSMPEGVWVVSPQGQTIFCNDRMAQILGCDVESLQRSSCFDPVFPEDLDEARRQFEGQMVGGEKPFEFRLRRKDGSPIWVTISCRPMHDDSGGVTGLLGLFTDCSERKRAEAMLRESEERFRTLADTVPAMIWVSGPDKLCTFCNKSWLDFTGRTIEQELGDGWATSIHPQDQDRCMDLYSSAFDERRSFQMEYRLIRANGEFRWVLDKGVPRIESDGRFAGYIGSCIDITDLKRAQELDVARQKLVTVGSVASRIMHDFGNLLAGITAYSEVMLEALASGSIPTVQEVESIRDTAVRGADIARQLMIYAEPENDGPELVNVSGIVEDMLELLKRSLPERIVLETHLDKQRGTVRASPFQICQIVMNLVTNAAEAIGDRDGRIRVTTGPLTVPESYPADFSAMMAGDYVQVEVSDTGGGMTPAVQAQIFDMFYTTKGSGNHGLGLTAVRWIVEHLHGGIRLSSTPGEHTVFQIMLPFEGQVIEAAESMTAAAADEAPASLGPTILVVEDDKVFRVALSTMLRTRRFSVLEASDGSAALDVIRALEERIDVVLLDINLPGAPSREVYEEMTRLRPGLTVIVTSAYSKEMAAASLGRKVGWFLRKPFRIHELIEIIREDSPST